MKAIRYGQLPCEHLNLRSRRLGLSADGVGDDPTGAGQSDADRVAGPIEVIARRGGKLRNPDQQLEDHDLRGEEARGKGAMMPVRMATAAPKKPMVVA